MKKVSVDSLKRDTLGRILWGRESSLSPQGNMTSALMIRAIPAGNLHKIRNQPSDVGHT